MAWMCASGICSKLRENFAVVLQDVFLFSGDIAGNIRLGNETIG